MTASTLLSTRSRNVAPRTSTFAVALLALAVIVAPLGCNTEGTAADSSGDLGRAPVAHFQLPEAFNVSPGNSAGHLFLQLLDPQLLVCDVSLEISIGGGPWQPIEVLFAGEGDANGNSINGFPTQELVPIVIDLTGINDLTLVRFRVVCVGIPSLPSGPCLVLSAPLPNDCDMQVGAPTGPGTVTGELPDYSSTIVVGDSLDFDVSLNDLAGYPYQALVKILSTATAAEIGFSRFDTVLVGVGECKLQYRGTAELPGTHQLRFTIVDACGDVIQMIHTIVVLPFEGVNRPPVVELIESSVEVTGERPDYEAIIEACTPFEMIFRGTDLDNDLMTLTASVVGGSLSPSEAGFDQPLPLQEEGVGTVLLTLSGITEKAGNIRLKIEANDGQLTDAIFIQLIIIPGPAERLDLQLLATEELICGPVDVRVTMYDACDNIAVGYLGTVQFLSSDPLAELVPAYTFTAEDAGQRDFTVVLRTPGLQTLTAQDILSPTLSATLDLEIGTGEAVLIDLTGLKPIAEPGECHDITVTVYDECGNIAVTYEGVVEFFSSDSAAILPPNHRFSAADQGQKTFPCGVRLSTPGLQTVTVRDVRNDSLQDTESSLVLDLPRVIGCIDGPECVRIGEEIRLSWELGGGVADKVLLNGEDVTGLTEKFVVPFPSAPLGIEPCKVYSLVALKNGMEHTMLDEFAFAKSISGQQNVTIAKVASFKDESFVVVGSIEDSTVFGQGEPNQTILIPVGGKDIFVARYHPDGTLDWALKIGSLGDERAHAVDAMPNGDIVVAGDFEQNLVVGLGEPTETTLQTANLAAFVLRLTGAGELRWAKAFTATNGIIGKNVKGFIDNEVAVTGWVGGTALFGKDEINETTTIGLGGTDAYVARLCANGTLRWVRRTEGATNAISEALTTVKAGDLVIGGHFFGSIVFGKDEPTETAFTAMPNHGLEDGFLARYDCDGNLLWASAITGSYDAGTTGLTTLPDDGVAATGYFQSITRWGFPGKTLSKTSGGLQDTFVARYAEDGEILWVQFHCNMGPAHGRDIASWPDGTVTVIGDFRTELVLGLGEPNQTHIFDVQHDAYIAKHAYADGNFLQVHRMGDAGQDRGAGVAVFQCGGQVAVGNYANQATFGHGGASETTLISAEAVDGFIARYDKINYAYKVVCPHGFSEAKPIIGTSNEKATVVAAMPDGGRVVAGTFDREIRFGVGESNEVLFVNQYPTEGPDMFLVRYAPDGALLWARHITGQFDETPWGIDTDCMGEIVLVGGYKCTCVFAFGEPNELELLDVGPNQDMFVARYSADGEFLWADKGHGPGRSVGRKVAFLPNGNIALAGFYDISLKLNFQRPSEIVLGGNNPERRMFAAVYDPTGTVLYATEAQNLANEEAIHLSAGCDSIVIVGAFRDQMTLGKAPGITETLVSSGEADGFVARFNFDLSLVWAKKFGGPANDYGLASAVSDVDELIYVGGHIGVPAQIGQFIIIGLPVTEMFVAAFDMAGNVKWLELLINGADGEMMTDMAAMPNGGVALTGAYRGQLWINIFDPQKQQSIQSEGGDDIFVVIFDNKGDATCVFTAGSTDDAVAWFIDAVPDESVMIAGAYRNQPLTFDRGFINETTLLNLGGEDAFSARYFCCHDDSSATPPVIIVPTCEIVETPNGD